MNTHHILALLLAAEFGMSIACLIAAIKFESEYKWIFGAIIVLLPYVTYLEYMRGLE
jgi:hypothetical protein